MARLYFLLPEEGCVGPINTSGVVGKYIIADKVEYSANNVGKYVAAINDHHAVC